MQSELHAGVRTFVRSKMLTGLSFTVKVIFVPLCQGWRFSDVP